MKSRQAGFTLIEVVAVAALLGVLVTMIRQVARAGGLSSWKSLRSAASVSEGVMAT